MNSSRHFFDPIIGNTTAQPGVELQLQTEASTSRSRPVLHNVMEVSSRAPDLSSVTTRLTPQSDNKVKHPGQRDFSLMFSQVIDEPVARPISSSRHMGLPHTAAYSLFFKGSADRALEFDSFEFLKFGSEFTTTRRLLFVLHESSAQSDSDRQPDNGPTPHQLAAQAEKRGGRAGDGGQRAGSAGRRHGRHRRVQASQGSHSRTCRLLYQAGPGAVHGAYHQRSYTRPGHTHWHHGQLPPCNILREAQRTRCRSGYRQWWRD